MSHREDILARKELEALIELGKSGLSTDDKAKVQQSFDGTLKLPYSKERMSTLRLYARSGVGVKEYAQDLECQIAQGNIKESDRDYWAIAEFASQAAQVSAKARDEHYEPGPQRAHISSVYTEMGTRSPVDKQNMRAAGLKQNAGRGEPTRAWKPKGWGKSWHWDRER